MYIVLAVLAFGVLIFVHEMGHFIAARCCGIRVLEFSIGMGSAIYKRQKDENSTLYSLRLFPFGGFCEMEGEDDNERLTPTSFASQPKRRRLAVLAAGAAMNLLVGFLVLLALTSTRGYLVSTVVDSFKEGETPTFQAGLRPDDRIVSLDGRAVHTMDDITYFLVLYDGAPVDIGVVRGGERVKIAGAVFPYRELDRYELTGDGRDRGKLYRAYYNDFYVKAAPVTPPGALRETFFNSIGIAKLIWRTLVQMASGRLPVSDLSGPVGVTSVMTEAARTGMRSFLSLFVFIAINLGVVNLLPLPALDGGRIAFILVEAVLGRPVPAKYEGAVHFAGLALLMIFSVIITFNDIIRLVN